MVAAVAERVTEHGGIRVVENCQAAPFRVEEYLLGQVKRVLSGEQLEAVIADYEVNLKDGSWKCKMPEEIRVGDEFLSVSEEQWIKAAGAILSKAGHSLVVLHEEYKKDLEIMSRITRRGPKEKVFPIGIYNLRGELFDLAVGGQFEVVLAGTPIEKNKRGWQILVRRKEVDKKNYNIFKVV